jgi:hypothetical protein
MFVSIYGVVNYNTVIDIGSRATSKYQIFQKRTLWVVINKNKITE